MQNTSKTKPKIAPKISRVARGKRPHFFDDKSVDQLLSMVLALMSETWVLRERMYTFEKLASAKGVLPEREIEGYRFSDAENAELASLRRSFLEEIFITLGADGESGAEADHEIDRLAKTLAQ